MNVFKALLSAVEAVPALNGKVYHAEALKNAKAPFAFWLQESESCEQALDGYTELEEARYEIHIVSSHLEELEEICEAVRTGLIALQGTAANGILYERVDISMISPVINEHEVNLYRKVYSLTINYQEE